MFHDIRNYNPKEGNQFLRGFTSSIWWKSLMIFLLLIVGLFLIKHQYSNPLNGESIEAQSPQPAILPNSLSSEHCQSFHHLQNEISLLQQQIWHNWNISYYPNFLKLMDIPSTSWRLQKIKLIQLLLSHIFKEKEDSFVIGFSGSSVTAGHDNYFNESYPIVVYQNLFRIFQLFNISLIVRNHAIGNNPCYAYDACIETHLGDDLDIVTWEQSMNCGRDVRPLDTFNRQAQNMRKKPTVIYFLSGSPIWTNASCGYENRTIELQNFRPPFTTAEKKLLTESFASIVNENHLMPSFDFLNDPHEKDTLPIRFASLAPMAHSVFPIQEYHCFGPYNESFSTKTPGGGASWHPGRLGHKLRGDSFSYAFLSILLEAVKDIESFACQTGQQQQRVFRKVKRRSLSSTSTVTLSLLDHQLTTLEKLLKLDLSANQLKEIKTSIEKAHPKNAFDTFHLFVHHYLFSYHHHITIDPVPIAYKLPETNTPSTCYTEFEPRMSHSLTSIIITSPSSTIANQSTTSSASWRKEFSFLDKNAVLKAEKRQLFYLDHKYTYLSTGNGSSISFNITSHQENVIWICELQKGFGKYPSTMTDLDQGAMISLYDSQGKKLLKTMELSLLTDQCYRTTNTIPKGNHILTITQKGDKQINIAYLVTW